MFPPKGYSTANRYKELNYDVLSPKNSRRAEEPLRSVFVWGIVVALTSLLNPKKETAHRRTQLEYQLSSAMDIRTDADNYTHVAPLTRSRRMTNKPSCHGWPYPSSAKMGCCVYGTHTGTRPLMRRPLTPILAEVNNTEQGQTDGGWRDRQDVDDRIGVVLLLREELV